MLVPFCLASIVVVWFFKARSNGAVFCFLGEISVETDSFLLELN